VRTPELGKNAPSGPAVTPLFQFDKPSTYY
jgi:hypothetical protein